MFIFNMVVTYAKHDIIGNMDYIHFSTDNNCVSISIDFGKNCGDGFQDEAEEVTTSGEEEEEDDDVYEDYQTAVFTATSNDISNGGSACISFLSSSPRNKNKAILWK